MRCASCGFENPDGMRFCGECGTPFRSRCPACNFDNPPHFKFCGECGAPLGKDAAPKPPPRKPDAARAPQPQPPRADAPGERKNITALFADIKGSMELMEDLD